MGTVLGSHFGHDDIDVMIVNGEIPAYDDGRREAHRRLLDRLAAEATSAFRSDVSYAIEMAKASWVAVEDARSRRTPEVARAPTEPKVAQEPKPKPAKLTKEPKPKRAPLTAEEKRERSHERERKAWARQKAAMSSTDPEVRQRAEARAEANRERVREYRARQRAAAAAAHHKA